LILLSMALSICSNIMSEKLLVVSLVLDHTACVMIIQSVLLLLFH